MIHNRTGYQSGCRCDECKADNARYIREYRDGVRRGRKSRKRGEPEHGKRRTYNVGCRCDLCVEANRAYQREYMRLRRAGIPVNDPLIDAALEGTRVNKGGAALRRKRPGM